MSEEIKKFKVEISISLSEETIKNSDFPDSSFEEYIRTELGWAIESFDGMEIELVEEKSPAELYMEVLSEAQKQS